MCVTHLAVSLAGAARTPTFSLVGASRLRPKRPRGPCRTRSEGRPGGAAWPRGTAGRRPAWGPPSCSAFGACGRVSSSGGVWAVASESSYGSRGCHFDRRAANDLRGAHRGSSHAHLATAIGHVPIAPADRAKAAAFFAAERLHGKQQTWSPSPATPSNQAIPLSYTSVSRSSAPNSISSPRRRGFGTKRASTSDRTVTRVGFEAAAAVLRNRRHHRPLDEHRFPVLLDRNDRSSSVQEASWNGRGKAAGAFDLKAVFGYLGDPDDHGGEPRSTPTNTQRRFRLTLREIRCFLQITSL